MTSLYTGYNSSNALKRMSSGESFTHAQLRPQFNKNENQWKAEGWIIDKFVSLYHNWPETL